MRRRSTSALVSCAIVTDRRCTFRCCAIHRSEIDVLVLCYSQIDVLVLCYSQIDALVLCYSRTNPTPRQPQELSSVDCVAPSTR